MTHLGLPSLLTGPSRKKRKGSVLLCAMFLKELWGSEQSAPIASNSKQGKTHTSLSPHPHKTTATRGLPAGSSWNVLCWFLALQKTINTGFSTHLYHTSSSSSWLEKHHPSQRAWQLVLQSRRVWCTHMFSCPQPPSSRSQLLHPSVEDFTGQCSKLSPPAYTRGHASTRAMDIGSRVHR